MQIVIPLAGEGSRFSQAGYTFPKPLIDIDGKPMIQRVVENLSFFDAEFVFLVRQSHLNTYRIEELLRLITGGKCIIVAVEALTQGAACTVLLAKEHINNEEELLIANSDQIIEYRPENFQLLRSLPFNSRLIDFIWTFNATNPKWSFAKTDLTGRIIEVAEKKPISDIATCGIYYWRQGSAFVGCAEEMLRRDIRVNGEFYVCPVYNLGIERGRQVYPFYVDKMWGVGTPEDLEVYLRHGRSSGPQVPSDARYVR